jgi:lysophospholipase L1-like esterase
MSKCAYRALVLLTACGLAAAANTYPLSASESAALNEKRHPFESEIAAFEKWDRQNAVPKDGVLFVGSSSIRLWQTAEAFPDLPVINRGFGGSTIAHVNHYFDRVVAKYEPRVIVFYSGDNDIASGKSPGQVFADFLTFVEKTRERLPNARILVISIKPSIARQKMWPQMQVVNAQIEKLAGDDERVEFVDIATPMLAGNEVPAARLLRDDGLHLNADGYALWKKVLAPALEKAASD